MRIIGLTGGIASGKTTVARMFEELGGVVVDADLLAREVVRPGEEAYQEIVAAFGEQVLHGDGTLNRAALGAIVFADPAARRTLEQITHPAIAKRAQDRLAELRQAGTRIVFYVAPLLIEAGITSRVDEVWVVYLNPEIQVQRLMARDGITRAEAQQRIDSQMPMDEKRRHGTVVIDNSGDLAALKEQVTRVWAEQGLSSGQ